MVRVSGDKYLDFLGGFSGMLPGACGLHAESKKWEFVGEKIEYFPSFLEGWWVVPCWFNKTISMATRIFNVEYWVSELYDGKSKSTFKENRNVVAKNAVEAIMKVGKINERPMSFKDENKKNVKVTRKDFEPINVVLRAEAE